MSGCCRVFGKQRMAAVVKALVSHQCDPGSMPRLGAICGLSLLLVLASASRDFSPGTPVSPSPYLKTNTSKCKLNLERCPQLLVLCAKHSNTYVPCFDAS